MTIGTVAGCGGILLGAIVMICSIVKSGSLLDAVPFIREASRQKITRLLNLHRFLMFFFLVGYLAVLVAFVLRSSFLSETFVGIIFLSGAIFVFTGITIEARLLTEIQKTLHGLLPICAICKKIREPNADREDPTSWTKLEEYISARSGVDFTHGYCPQSTEEHSAVESGVPPDSFVAPSFDRENHAHALEACPSLSAMLSPTRLLYYKRMTALVIQMCC